MTTAEAQANRDERRSYYLDIAIAALLGIAAIATAWAAYQSSLFGGDEAEAFNASAVHTGEAAVKTDQASQAWTNGDQAYIHDQQLFLEYVKAAQLDDTGLAQYLRESLMSPELIAAIGWWEQQPDDGPQSPFDDSNPEYVNASYDTAAGLDDEAQALLAQATAANQEANKLGDIGDKYDFATVILASSLFILGIGGVFRQLPIKLGMGALGAVLLVSALIQVAGLDRA
jgi:hypothetical protein